MKKKHGGAHVVFFVSACVTHSLVEKLTVLFGNNDKNPVNEEA